MPCLKCIKYSLFDLEQSKKFNKQKRIITLLVTSKDNIKGRIKKRTHSHSSSVSFLSIECYSLSSTSRVFSC